MPAGGAKSKEKVRVHTKARDTEALHPGNSTKHQDDRDRPVQVDDLYHEDAPHTERNSALPSIEADDSDASQSSRSPITPHGPTPAQDLDLLTAGMGGDPDRAGAAQRLQRSMGNRGIGKIPSPHDGRRGKG